MKDDFISIYFFSICKITIRCEIFECTVANCCVQFA